MDSKPLAWRSSGRHAGRMLASARARHLEVIRAGVGDPHLDKLTGFR